MLLASRAVASVVRKQAVASFSTVLSSSVGGSRCERRTIPLRADDCRRYPFQSATLKSALTRVAGPNNQFLVSDPRASNIRSFSSQPPNNNRGQSQLPPWMHPESNKPGHYLEQYTTDLTALAAAGKLDPVIGRHEEIRRCLQILARRTKSNPVLIGEAGVGKTAIAEGLAQRIQTGQVPESMKDKRVLSLDLAALTAGSFLHVMVSYGIHL